MPGRFSAPPAWRCHECNYFNRPSFPDVPPSYNKYSGVCGMLGCEHDYCSVCEALNTGIEDKNVVVRRSGRGSGVGRLGGGCFREK
jgi:hypothetical protein